MSVRICFSLQRPDCVLMQRIFAWRERMEQLTVGCGSLKEVSVSAWGCYEELDGDDVPLIEFHAIVRHLLGQLTEGTVKYGHEVCQVWPVPCTPPNRSMEHSWPRHAADALCLVHLWRLEVGVRVA